MENEQGKIQILKEEAAPIPDIVVDLFTAMKTYKTEFDERFIHKIGEEVGFISSDDKVFKLLGCVAEEMADSIISSIN